MNSSTSTIDLRVKTHKVDELTTHRDTRQHLESQLAEARDRRSALQVRGDVFAVRVIPSIEKTIRLLCQQLDALDGSADAG